ncbi:MAG: hypothetical protein IPH20_21295 [Bacteroidales bacterium]|nr:hypothetical protein [Bacteroidales bacterium]
MNIDFEAVFRPSNRGRPTTGSVVGTALVVPGAELSIAAPAANWSNTLSIPAIALGT